MIKSEFFIGVVVDISDPSQLGRVRVRTINQTDDLLSIPTINLPWAQVMQPANNPSLNGMGWSPTGILRGSWVVGFYQGGKDCHSPIILGTLPGISTATNPEKGFCDILGEFPRETHLDEPDVNRLARGESEWINPNDLAPTATKLEETVHALNLEAVVTGIMSGDVEWNQPEPSYKAVYPHNKVYESPSGHIIEIDDTAEAERLFINHKSGTFIEIMPDGAVNQRIQTSEYKIILKDKNLSVTGNLNITVTGDTNLSVTGNVTENITGNVTRTVDGDVTEDIKGNFTRTIGKNLTDTVSGDSSTKASGNVNINGTMINLN
jgi:hypothetical protein